MSSAAQVPGWASFLTPAQYERFTAAVEEDLGRRGLPFELGDGVASVELAKGRTSAWGLQNLAQKCHQAKDADWPAVIRGHFDAMVSASTDDRAFAKSFETARPLLKLRLYSDEAMQEAAQADLVARPLAAGLFGVLSFDLPTHTVTVGAKEAAAWGRPMEELLETGLLNVRAEPPPAHDVHEFEGGAEVHVLHGESFFTATRALLLADYLDPAAVVGALVAVPHRHACLFHPMLDIHDTVRAINAMIPLTLRMYREGPGSISPNLYWWHDRQLDVLPTEVTPNAIQFAPPDEFIQQVLNPLAEKSRRQ